MCNNLLVQQNDIWHNNFTNIQKDYMTLNCNAINTMFKDTSVKKNMYIFLATGPQKCVHAHIFLIQFFARLDKLNFIRRFFFLKEVS